MSSRVRIGRRDCKTVYGVCVAARTKLGNQKNISVVNLVEGQTVFHGLSTTKIEVTFFDTNGRNVKENDFEIVNTNTIKIYLPILESGASTFTGDIFVKRRI